LIPSHEIRTEDSRRCVLRFMSRRPQAPYALDYQTGMMLEFQREMSEILQ
jgi:hypothetical protein